jgi:hypothetical protein
MRLSWLTRLAAITMLTAAAGQAAAQTPLQDLASGQVTTFTSKDIAFIYEQLQGTNDAQSQLAIQALTKYFSRDVLPDREEEQQVLDELAKLVEAKRLLAYIMEALSTIYTQSQHLNDAAKATLANQIEDAGDFCTPVLRKPYGNMLYGLAVGSRGAAQQADAIDRLAMLSGVTGELQKTCGAHFVADFGGGNAYQLGLLARLSGQVEPSARQRIAEVFAAHHDQIRRKVSLNRLCEMTNLLKRNLTTEAIKKADPSNIITEIAARRECQRAR